MKYIQIALIGVLVLPVAAVSQQIRSNDYLETKWRAIGNTHPVNPHVEVGPPVRETNESHQWVLNYGYYGLRPSIDTEDIDPWVNQPGDNFESKEFPFESGINEVNYPNDHVGLNVHALFDEAFVNDGAVEGRQTLMSGGAISAVGGGKSTSASSVDYAAGVQVIGMTAQGTVLAGDIIGIDRKSSINHGDFRITAHGLNAFAHSNLAHDVPKDVDWRLTPKFVDALFGGLLEVYVGKEAEGDARIHNGTLSPSHIRMMIGEDVQVALDNNVSVSQWQSPLNPEPLFDVVASPIALYWFVGNVGQILHHNSSRMNLGTLRLASNILDLSGMTPADEGQTHRVVTWIGAELKAPSVRPGEFNLLGSYMGANVSDLDHTAGAQVRSRLSRLITSSHFPTGLSMSYSLMTAGTIVLGDGESQLGVTGYDTDVVHLNDVLRLAPLTEPPSLSDLDLPNSEKIGRLFYSSNTLEDSPAPIGLYVSVLEVDGTVGWRKVKVDGEYVPTTPPAGNKTLEDADHQLSLVNEPVSATAHPESLSLANATSGTISVTLMVTGFMEIMPSVESQLVQAKTGSKDIIPENSWIPAISISDLSISLGAGPNTVISVTLSIPPEARAGDYFLIRAVDTTDAGRYAYIPQELIP